MEIGDFAHGGIYVGTVNSHHIICSPIEYELPFEVNWFQAKEYCKSISMGLPTRKELNLLYELYTIAPEYFPKRVLHGYWSSAERSSTVAWLRYFSSGSQSTNYKSNNYYVRAVRRVEIPA